MYTVCTCFLQNRIKKNHIENQIEIERKGLKMENLLDIVEFVLRFIRYILIVSLSWKTIILYVYTQCLSKKEHNEWHAVVYLFTRHSVCVLYVCIMNMNTIVFLTRCKDFM